MKILITTDCYKHTINGVSNSIQTLVSEMRERGHEVKILALSDSMHSYKEGDEYYISSFFIFLYPDARYSLRFHDPLIRELIEWKPDLVHLHTEFASKHLAMRIIRHVHCPYVFSCHTIFEQYVRYATANLFSLRWYITLKMGIIYRHASVLIVPSKKMKRIIRSYHVRRPIAVIPTGIDLNRYQKRIDADQKKELLQSLHLDDTNKILVVLSRLSREKNIEELIRYMPSLLKEDDEIRMIIVGEGPDKKHLAHLAKKLDLTDHIVFTGVISPERAYCYYQLGNIFVCASTFESQGLTYAEALASGLPLVCRKDPCLTPVLTHGENGYIYETEEEYVTYILDILNDPEKQKRMSEVSYQKSFAINRKRFGDRMEHLYQKVLEHSS